MVPKEIRGRKGHKDRREIRVTRVQLGLLVPLGQQARPALLGQLEQMGPLDRKVTPAQQAQRARLELMVSLAPTAAPASMVLLVRKGRKAILAQQGLMAR